MSRSICSAKRRACAETLFSEIQRLFERTYASVGINLEECLIDRQRCGQLSRAAGASARELSELARTFLRRTGDRLSIGIYYSRWLIEQLEKHDPRRGLSNENIRGLIAFVEEINHALHAALQFQAGQREIRERGFRAEPGVAGAGGYLPGAAAFHGLLPQGAAHLPRGPALAAVPSFRDAASARLLRSQSARALPGNGPARGALHAVTWIRSTACAAWRKFGAFTRSASARRRRTSWPCGIGARLVKFSTLEAERDARSRERTHKGDRAR